MSEWGRRGPGEGDGTHGEKDNQENNEEDDQEGEQGRWSTPSSRLLIVSSKVRSSSATLSGDGPTAQPCGVARAARGAPFGGCVAIGSQPRSSASFGFGDTQLAGTVARIRCTT